MFDCDRYPRRVLVLLSALMFVIAVVGSIEMTKANDMGPSSEFALHGTLKDGLLPANGSFDFEIKLMDAAAGGSAIVASSISEDVSVVDGRYVIVLDFGSAVFNGQALWIELGVREGADIGAFDLLSPRSPINSVPYAIRAGESGDSPWEVGPLSGTAAARTDSFGQLAYSSGSFAVEGDAQTSMYVLRGASPTDDATTEMFLDGFGQRIKLPQGKSMFFSLIVVGQEQSGTGLLAGRIEGFAANLGGVTSGIITSEEQLHAQGLTLNPLAWPLVDAANVSFDDSVDAMRITGANIFDEPARWVGVLRTVEIGL